MVAINTDFKGQTPSTEQTKDLLNRISQAGFSHVHWVHDWNGSYLYSSSQMYQIKEWIDDSGLKIKGIHASDGTTNDGFDDRKMFISPIEANRIAGVELVKNRIDFASVIDAGVIVLHIKLFHEMLPNSEYESLRETYWEQKFKSFDEIIAYATEKGIKVTVENMEHPGDELQFQQFDRLYDRYTLDQLGFCLDLGHNMISNKENPFSFLERYNNRLSMLHLNCGLLNLDNVTDYKDVLALDVHMIPTRECIDFDRLTDLIASSPYKLPLAFEIESDLSFDDTLKSVLGVGNELTKLVEEKRKDE